ncbi:MAG: glycosyltransferase family 2 protein [Butyrivibrio sp.]|nr:glycosyltransferase family 2 protein [Butyrivibrio sp.]
MKKVSVIIPCHNVSEWVYQSWKSIKNQTMDLSEIECIFVDDASDDEGKTWEVLQRIEKEAPESVMIISLDENIRQGGARNVGMSYMSGEYMLFLDADDLYRPETCQELYDYAVANDLDLVQFDHEIVFRDLSDDSIPPKDPEKEEVICDLNEVGARQLFLTGAAGDYGCTNKFYRSSLLKKAQSHFAEKVVYEEPLFVYPIFFYINKMAIVDTRYYIWRKREGSTMTSELGSLILEHALVQLELIRDIKARSELYSRYKAEADFHFFHSYFYETILFSILNYGTRLYTSHCDELKNNLFAETDGLKENRYLDERPVYKELYDLLSDNMSFADWKRVQDKCLKIYMADHKDAASSGEGIVMDEPESYEDSFPLISVIMPVRNNEKYFPVAVQSVLDQEYPNWELIILEGISTDNTAQVAKELAARDPRIRVITSGEWIYEKINIGVNASKGEYFTVLNSDDKFTSDALLIAANFIKKYNVDLVLYPVATVYCDKDQNVLQDDIKRIESIVDHEFVLRTFDDMKKNWINLLASGLLNNQTNVYKKELVKDIRFRNDVYGGDYLFNLASLPRFSSAAYYPKVTYLFHQYVNVDGMNASVGKYYGYEHRMFNEFYHRALQLFALHDVIDEDKLKYILDKRVSDFSYEIRIMKYAAGKLSLEEMIHNIFSYAADIASLYPSGKLPKDTEIMVIYETKSLMDSFDGESYGKMEKVARGVKEILSISKEDPFNIDIKCIQEMVFDYNNPARVGESIYNDIVNAFKR